MTVLVCIAEGLPAETLRVRGTPARSQTRQVRLPIVEIGRHDAAAIGVAVRLGQHLGERTVAVSVGGIEAELGLRSAIALGCQRALRVDALDLLPLDSRTVAHLLAATAARFSGISAVVTGIRGSQWETGQTPGFLACVLGWPLVAGITGIQGESGTQAHLTWRSGSSQSSREFAASMVLSVQRFDGNRPATPSLSKTIAAFDDDIDVIDGREMAPQGGFPKLGAVLMGSRLVDRDRERRWYSAGELQEAASATATEILRHYQGF